MTSYEAEAVSIFLTSILYGLSMGLILQGAEVPYVPIAIVSGVFFGGLTTIILTLLQNYNLKKTGNYGAEVELNNFVRLELEGTSEEILHRCLMALDELKNSSLLEMNLKEGFIRAKTGTSWWSWGETLHFKIEPLNETRQNVVISSRPSLPTTLIDYGKNLDNIKRLERFLLR